MEQLPLFSAPDWSIVYEQEAGRRKKLTRARATVYTPEGEAFIFLETEVKNARGLRYEMLKLAREALILNKVRPFGDEYDTDLAHVTYLFER